MKVNTNNGDNISFIGCQFQKNMSGSIYQYTTISGYLNPVIADSGTEILSIEAWHTITEEGTYAPYKMYYDNNVSFNESDGKVYFRSSTPISWAALRGNYFMVFTVKVNYRNADNTTGNKVGDFWLSAMNFHWGSVGQLSISSPVSGSSLIGAINFVTSVDTEAEYYDISISKNGNVVYTNTQTGSNSWNIDLTPYGAGSYTVKARGGNSVNGYGEWSNETPFTLMALPTLSSFSTCDPKPTKPNHSITISASYAANGNTITDKRLYISTTGYSNMTQLTASGDSPFSATQGYDDNGLQIYYCEARLYYTMPNSQTGYIYTRSEVTYWEETEPGAPPRP